MSASRLGRIEELFHEALARPAGERRAFVSEASDDTELVREVNALLEDHDSAAGYFQELTLKLADSATSELEGVASTGMVIGAYRTVRLLGRGGMGSVFLAERADGHYSQQVAVKLIRRGMDSEDLIRRFVSERQILARLNHPNIARLLDGGLSEDDRPYLILEYIEGTPLTTYCDDRHLDIDARLKLFIRVGRAVAYAHGSLVVHRDLKPSNIVVTRKGVVKLLDFGIAKILSEEGSEQRTHTVTVTGSRILTPEYAAPEQITGGAITTATDVYGLGVVLYELLTGSRPLTLTDGSLVELERRVLEQHPTRPSACVARSGKRDGVARKRSTNAKRLSRRLSGELDTICEMALRKEPERRYRSVERFIEDMERHQAGLPVSAQADTLGYRARKFVQRHSLGVAAVSAFAILVTGFGVVTAAQSARLVRERDKAEKVSELFVDLFRGYDPSETRGRTVTAREILDEGVRRIEVELSDQPEIHSALMDAIGRVYQNLGLYDSAAPLLEGALEMRRSGDQVVVAESLDHLGLLLADRGEYEGAEALFREALAMNRKYRGVRDASISVNLNHVGMALFRKSDYPAAEAAFREAFNLGRALHGDEHPFVATNLNNLASVMAAQGADSEAVALYEAALAIRRDVLPPEHPHLAYTLYGLGRLHSARRAPDKAVLFLREALDIRQKVLGEDHVDTAEVRAALGHCLTQLEDYAQAERLLLRSRETLAAQRGEDHMTVRQVDASVRELYELWDQSESATSRRPGPK